MARPLPEICIGQGNIADISLLGVESDGGTPFLKNEDRRKVGWRPRLKIKKRALSPSPDP